MNVILSLSSIQLHNACMSTARVTMQDARVTTCTMHVFSSYCIYRVLHVACHSFLQTQNNPLTTKLSTVFELRRWKISPFSRQIQPVGSIRRNLGHLQGDGAPGMTSSCRRYVTHGQWASLRIKGDEQSNGCRTQNSRGHDGVDLELRSSSW